MKIHALLRNLFHFVSKQRSIDGICDRHFAAILNGLTYGPYPLLECDRPLPNYQNQAPVSKVSLTSIGLDVLYNQQDYLEIEERDWWLGEVFLKIINGTEMAIGFYNGKREPGHRG
ncbi:hypothetical protein [Neobacillus ginsengisoli]|uniref:Uncharacterized protein n=1 Tax=Neobacillus ginsengisoli TaxID=904295 RepID=A0ABT9Y0Z6_9BACI|nr:hypothetical protein [Neobacillus ginsengisoli]MDQ0201501.1 hypothetical protein [Neobacillus ginsengisoli]